MAVHLLYWYSRGQVEPAFSEMSNNHLWDERGFQRYILAEHKKLENLLFCDNAQHYKVTFLLHCCSSSACTDRSDRLSNIVRDMVFCFTRSLVEKLVVVRIKSQEWTGTQHLLPQERRTVQLI